MCKAKITFCNNETLIIKDGDLFIPINSFAKPEQNGYNKSADPNPRCKFDVSQGMHIEIWQHSSNGLIPSICEFLCNSLYFCHIDNQDIVYRSSSVIKIENI